MGQCRDCRWWDVYDEEEAPGFTPTLGRCELTYRQTAATEIVDRPEPPYIAVLNEDSWDVMGVTVWLTTPPDFGCVLFQVCALVADSC